MTRSCYKQCKSIKNEECFNVCFEKYVRTMATVNEEIRRLAYAKHSLFAYKGYPEPSIESAYLYDNALLWNFGKAPFAYNRDYAA